MDEFDLLAATAARLEDLGHYAEVQTREVRLGDRWTERRTGLMVDDAFVRVFTRKGHKDRWWVEVGELGTWACKGAGAELAVARLVELVLARLPEPQAAPADVFARVKARGLECWPAGPMVRLTAKTPPVLVEGRAVTDELLDDWAALLKEQEERLTSFRRRHNLPPG